MVNEFKSSFPGLVVNGTSLTAANQGKTTFTVVTGKRHCAMAVPEFWGGTTFAGPRTIKSPGTNNLLIDNF